ncbi:MAG: hypothetical protein LQ340_001036 [Diploschistes diacapsis]|nr:MAG: hypothetical protein LQ340_001036 [Diploschistes diacapsis]
MELHVCLAIPIIFFTAWLYTAYTIQTRIPTLRNKAIVLLIAHPDDEAMFFAPTVLGLTRPDLGNHLKILCLSSGNADSLGATRKTEILSSAAILGLRSDADVLVYDNPDLFPDSMTRAWDPAAIASVLASFFAKAPTPAGSGSGSRRKQADTADSARTRGEAPAAGIDVLITFDRDGVSGHPNHGSLYHGAVAWLRLLMRGKAGWECPVALYRLASTNVVRKYMALLDAPLTMVLCVLDSMRTAAAAAGKKGQREMPGRLMFLSDFTLYRRAQRAMTRAHVSQMRWFRWGWICLSRYMVVNDLEKERLVFR